MNFKRYISFKPYITTLIAVLLLSGANYLLAQPNLTAYTYTVSFKIRNAGIVVNGTLKNLKATIKFSPDQLETSSIIATVASGTIDTRNSSRDQHLRSDDYFDVDHYPTISLSSIHLYKKDNDFAGLFNLTIKNTTKQVEIPFTYTEKEGLATFDGNFQIDRRDYDVGNYSLILSDQVNIHILVNAKK